MCYFYLQIVRYHTVHLHKSLRIKKGFVSGKVSAFFARESKKLSVFRDWGGQVRDQDPDLHLSGKIKPTRTDVGGGRIITTCTRLASGSPQGPDSW